MKIHHHHHHHLQFILTATSLLLFPLQPSTAAATITTNNNNTDFIRISCNTTLYPDICYTSLSGYASTVQQNPARLARVAISLSLNSARHMSSYLSNISTTATTLTAAALHDCRTNFGDAVYQIRGSLKEMRRAGKGGAGESFRFQMSNVQTWMSAALTDEETCTDGLEGVDGGKVKTEVCDLAAEVKKFTSNALALVNNCAASNYP